MLVRQDEITYEASGEGIRDRGLRGVVDGCIVEWDEDGSNVRPGPNKSNTGVQVCIFCILCILYINIIFNIFCIFCIFCIL
jgi:hypothetical protein